MKKLLLLLLCVPLIGFGQGWIQNFYFSNASSWPHGNVEEINGSGYVFFGDEGFIKTDYNGDTLSTNLNYRWLRDGCQTLDGGYVLLSYDSVYKLDGMGLEQWGKPHYEGEANAITQVSDSGYVITGVGGASSMGPGGISKADEHIGVVKMNSSGDTLWRCQVDTHNINFDIEGSGEDVIQANNGDYIIAASRMFPSLYDNPALLVRINDLGDTLWTKQYLFGSAAKAYSVVENNFGNITFTGSWYVYDSTASNTECASLLLTQTDSQGNIIWVKTYQSWCESHGLSIEETNDGGYIICGALGLQNDEQKIWLLKTDNQGDTLWTKTFGNPYGYGTSAKQTTDGGYIIGGYGWQNSFSNSIMLIKIDSSGNTTSTLNIPITNSNRKLDIVVDVLGRATKGKINEPLFYIYDDGTVEKRITIE